MGVEVGEVTAATGDVESWGPVNTFRRSCSNRCPVGRDHQTSDANGQRRVQCRSGPDDGQSALTEGEEVSSVPELVVVGSGTSAVSGLHVSPGG